MCVIITSWIFIRKVWQLRFGHSIQTQPLLKYFSSFFSLTAYYSFSFYPTLSLHLSLVIAITTTTTKIVFGIRKGWALCMHVFLKLVHELSGSPDRPLSDYRIQGISARVQAHLTPANELNTPYSRNLFSYSWTSQMLQEIQVPNRFRKSGKFAAHLFVTSFLSIIQRRAVLRFRN